MKLSIDLGRWTTLRSVCTAGAALMLAGVIGHASAVSPTTEAPIKWKGGVATDPKEFALGPVEMFKVPAGNNFMLTDVIVGTFGPAAYVELYASPDGCADFARKKLRLAVPGDGSVVIPLITGIGFTPGQSICLRAGTDALKEANIRGFLFTAAPAG